MVRLLNFFKKVYCIFVVKWLIIVMWLCMGKIGFWLNIDKNVIKYFIYVNMVLKGEVCIC